ncbi:hypothetical protein [Dyella sp.]|uniref:hypothetical protein n=1 Tax=Dyella sp. TaxID=1869338 RepID=UPI002ED4FD3E
MHIFRFGPFGALVLLLLVPAVTHASGGSYLVDDASTTPAGHCQLESWLQVFRDGHVALTSTPACARGPVEFSLGLSRLNAPHGDSQMPAMKWLVRDGGDQGLSIALDANTTFEHGHHVANNAYAAFSQSLDATGQWTANVNLGVDQVRGNRWRALAGVGLEYAPVTEVSFLVEHLRIAGRSSSTQGGVRFHIGSSSLDLVLGYNRDRQVARWGTVGWNMAF